MRPRYESSTGAWSFISGTSKNSDAGCHLSLPAGKRLIDRGLVHHVPQNSADQDLTTPKGNGSLASRLVTGEFLECEHYGVALSPDERQRVYTWIDANPHGGAGEIARGRQLPPSIATNSRSGNRAARRSDQQRAARPPAPAERPLDRTGA
jgi:hypothetical protein